MSETINGGEECDRCGEECTDLWFPLEEEHLCKTCYKKAGGKIPAGLGRRK